MEKQKKVSSEIKCNAVMLSMAELGITPSVLAANEEPPENFKSKVEEIEEYADNFGYVGTTVLNGEYCAILIKSEFENHVKALCAWLWDKGYRPMAADKYIYVDSRYLKGGDYYGYLVPLPTKEVDDAIKKLLNRYCTNVTITDDLSLQCLVFRGELASGTEVLIKCAPDFLCGGIKRGAGYATHNPDKYYDDVMSRIEKDILRWIDEHRSVYNRNA